MMQKLYVCYALVLQLLPLRAMLSIDIQMICYIMKTGHYINQVLGIYHYQIAYLNVLRLRSD